MKRVLVIEDDMDAANVLEAYLKREHFNTCISSNGKAGLDLVFSWKPDIVLLDVMLPEMNGTDILLNIRRRSSVPVVMITAISDAPDKISALRFGADDYVVKPYNPGEVVARVHAILRRYDGNNIQSTIEFGRFRADTDAMNVKIADDSGVYTELELTPTELLLLFTFLKNPHKAFTRQNLLENCLPESDALERVVDTHVYNLRKKLEAVGQTNILVNVRGIGYRFTSS